MAASGGVDACPQTCATSGEHEEGHGEHAQKVLEENFIDHVVLFGEGNARAEVQGAERCGSCWQPPMAARHDMGEYCESPQTADTICLDQSKGETSDAGHQLLV